MPLTTTSSDSATARLGVTVAKSNKTASTSAIVLLPANARRVGATIVNRSTAPLYIDFGAEVSVTDFAVEIPPNGYYETPFACQQEMRGVWRASNGKALIRDFVEE